MGEGELKKHQKYVVKDEWIDEEPTDDIVLQDMTVPMVFSSTIDEAKKDLFSGYPKDEFLKEALRKIAEEEPNNHYAVTFVKLEKWFGGSS